MKDDRLPASRMTFRSSAERAAVGPTLPDRPQFCPRAQAPAWARTLSAKLQLRGACLRSRASSTSRPTLEGSAPSLPWQAARGIDGAMLSTSSPLRKTATATATARVPKVGGLWERAHRGHSVAGVGGAEAHRTLFWAPKSSTLTARTPLSLSNMSNMGVIPDEKTKRLALIDKIADYLKDHPTAANADKAFTEVRARALSKALTDGRSALNAAVRTRVKAKGDRNSADGLLYSRLSGLLAELGQLLTDDSEDWYWFGFVPPAGAERPAKPEGLHAEQVGPATLLLGWPHPPRAEKMRVLVQVVGRDPAPLPQDWTRGNDFTLTALPPKATVKLQLEPATPPTKARWGRC